MTYLTDKELKKFASVGSNVFISVDAIIFGPENISIGNNVRIDALCVIQASSGFMIIHNNVHLATRSMFLCIGGITINSFSQVATNCTFLTASDDFSGEHLIGPMVDDRYRKVEIAPVVLDINCVVGAHSILSPGTFMETNSGLGAMSMTKSNQRLLESTLYVGVTAKPIKKRSTGAYRFIYSPP